MFGDVTQGEAYFDLAMAAADHAPLDLCELQVPVTLVAGSWDILTSSRDMVKTAGTAPPRSDSACSRAPHFLPAENLDELVDQCGEPSGTPYVASTGRRRRLRAPRNARTRAEQSRPHQPNESQWAGTAST